ncbi:MAG: AAA family ATPase [Lachnospiraceae bacterium]|nr:AAA family ATPase [Lachnospiraceae bacterium]
MNQTVKLPVGIDNFEELRTEDFYYVDKTGLIKELLQNWSKVNLFTRPRRFGKSLNMSMLKCFFEYGCDSSLFEGLAIAGETELCEKYMGKFPVISVSLKDASAGDYREARQMLCSIIRNEAQRFPFLLESNSLTEEEKELYRQLIAVGGIGEAAYTMPDSILTESLLLLCRFLYKHYKQKAVLLIDEYDVPLDKARHYGYYDEMVKLVRNLYSRALKSNDFLQFAVMTGCLKIARESIFTGLNNLRVFSVMNVQFDEHFGFSHREVREMLEYYGYGDRFELAREWYDGYRFGNADVYCPWDVINYCADLRADPKASPRAFWINTSGNDIIRSFIQTAKPGTRRELELLVNGESVNKRINQELTYRDLYSNQDNLWSVLFMTGYLTLRGEADGDTCQLAIPNREIRKIFIDQILDWFQEEARRDAPKLDAFCAAFPKADAGTIESLFNAYLARTISIRDTGVRKGKKENFYHGILLGLLSHREDWYIRSNAESGNGFSDILIEIEEEGIGIVIEVKYPDSPAGSRKSENAGDKPAGDASLEKGCAEALEQIERLGYDAALRMDGMDTVIKYGIACDRKRCRVMALT